MRLVFASSRQYFGFFACGFFWRIAIFRQPTARFFEFIRGEEIMPFRVSHHQGFNGEIEASSFVELQMAISWFSCVD